MKIPHPAYFYNLYFKTTKPRLQELISRLKHDILKWNGITSGVHPMGGVAFKLDRKEIGHIHWNGNLDIMFGKTLTEKLLKIEGIQQHRFVPEVAVTFPVSQPEDLIFADALLRFSYILKLKKSKSSIPEMEDFITYEVNKLPNTLRQLVSAANFNISI